MDVQYTFFQCHARVVLEESSIGYALRPHPETMDRRPVRGRVVLQAVFLEQAPGGVSHLDQPVQPVGPVSPVGP